MLIKVDELFIPTLSVVERTSEHLKADCPCCRHIVASVEKGNHVGYVILIGRESLFLRCQQKYIHSIITSVDVKK